MSHSFAPALAQERAPLPGRLAGSRTEVVPLAEAARIAVEWRELADRAAEPNPFFRPEFLLPIVDYLAPRAPRAVLVRSGGRLIGLLPMVRRRVGFGLTGRHDCVVFHEYGPLGTPLIDSDAVEPALRALLQPGCGLPRSLVVHLDADGPVAAALFALCRETTGEPVVLEQFERAALAAERDLEQFLRGDLDRKKRKDLARLWRRLEGHGTVHHAIHAEPAAVTAALERFMLLEASGWKGKRHSALGAEAGRAAIARQAVLGLAAAGRARVDEITLDGMVVASLVSFLDGRRLFTWKIAHAEAFAQFSPGSQIVLALTRSVLPDPAVAFADSLATPNHPMIDHLWRQRIRIVRALVPLVPLPAFESRAIAAEARSYRRLYAGAREAIGGLLHSIQR